MKADALRASKVEVAARIVANESENYNYFDVGDLGFVTYGAVCTTKQWSASNQKICKPDRVVGATHPQYELLSVAGKRPRFMVQARCFVRNYL